MTRLSGLLAARPTAANAVGVRYYGTDSHVIYYSTGSAWLDNWPLVIEQGGATGLISAPLAQRPAAAKHIGWAFTDTDTGNTYEAFPDGWAAVTFGPTAAKPGGDDTQVQFNNSGAFGGDGQFLWTGLAVFVGPIGIGIDGSLAGMTSVSSTTIDAITNLTLHNGAVAGLSYQNNHQLIVGDVNHSYMIFGGAESAASFRDVDGRGLYFYTEGGYEFDGGHTIFDFPAIFYDLVKLAPIATPSSPEEGMIYANRDDHHLYFYNGTAWKQLDN